ncbi:cupin, partial [Streptomyces californicus]
AEQLRITRTPAPGAASGDADLPAGTLHPIPRERHGLLALRDAAVLLTAVND